MNPEVIEKLKHSIKIVETAALTVVYTLDDKQQVARAPFFTDGACGIELPFDGDSREERRDWVDNHHENRPSERSYLEADLILHDALVEALRTAPKPPPQKASRRKRKSTRL